MTIAPTPDPSSTEDPTPNPVDELGLTLTDEDRETAEQMLSRLQQTMQSNAPEEDEPEEDDEDVQDEDVPEVPTDASEVTPPNTPPEVPLSAYGLSPEELTNLRQLRDYLNSHPEQAAQVNQIVTGQAPTPAFTPPAPPPELDMDDPAIKTLWSQQVALQQQIAEMRSGTVTRQEVAAKEQAQQQTDLGVTAFRTTHPHLTDEDIAALRQHTVSLGILTDSFINRFPTPAQAVAKSLELAAYDDPELRARLLTAPSPADESKKKTTARKKTLSALAPGSNGSAPRETVARKPKSDFEMKADMAAWLEEQGVVNR